MNITIDMKDFIKVFLLIIGGLLLYIGLALIGGLSPFLLAMLRIIISVAVIGGGILLLRNKWTHRLPRQERKKYLKEYKKQFKK